MRRRSNGVNALVYEVVKDKPISAIDILHHFLAFQEVIEYVDFAMDMSYFLAFQKIVAIAKRAR